MSKADELFDALTSRIAKLKTHFLKDRTTDLDTLEEDFDLHAYSLMAHATFENYFEALAALVLDGSISQWSVAKQSNKTILCLLSHYSGDTKRASSDLVEKYVFELLKTAQAKHRDRIRKNNGIKSGDIHNIFGPVGIDGYVNQAAVNALGIFGEHRGAIAHTVIQSGSSVVRGITDVLNWIDEALILAKILRDEANELLV